MLTSLKVKNYALIESLDINFESGLNIITGETGAGKSILIDALSLILGERASIDAIRKGEERATVEGSFDIGNNKSIKIFLDNNEIENSNELILRREITSKGTSRSFINDSPVSLNILKSLGDLLVDLHGQHEHQSLLDASTHLDYLDDFAQTESLNKIFKIEFSKFSTAINKYNELKKIEGELNQKKDLFQFQLNEIENVNPILGEEDELERERKLGEHSEKIREIASEIYGILSFDDAAVLQNLGIAKKKFDELKNFDESFEQKISEIESVVAIVKELVYEIEKLKDAESFSLERLEEIRNRLGAISMLKKKFGGSIESVLDLKDKIKSELNLAENFEEELLKLKNEINSQRKVLEVLSSEILEKRKSASIKLEKEIISHLADLGIRNAKFKVEFSQNEIEKNSETEFYVLRNKNKISISNSGADDVEFYLSANLGEEQKKLTEVASGGEVSRIMLSLKSALAKNARIPTLIFDEIDTGISGRIGSSVGKKLLELSKSHQVISITHLAQIAAIGKNHFVVEKIENQSSTSTKLKKLSAEERILEIAKLLSGEKITDQSIKSAKELINQV